MNINILEYLNDILKETKVNEFMIKKGSYVVNIKRSQEEINKVMRKDKEEEKKVRKEKKVKEFAGEESAVDESNVIQVTSKTVGVFYRGKTKISAPLVKEGSVVKKGDQLGIINCMGVIEKVISTADGVISEVLVNNHKPVEYGQPLFVIQPE